jgi:hypothetical protein
MALADAVGCSLMQSHRFAPLPSEDAEPCQTLPQCCRDHVYIFLVNGLDPFNKNDFAGLADYLRSLGFSSTHFGQFWHASSLCSQIRQIKQEDPEARLVVVGYSCGANVACRMTHAVQSDGIDVDLLVYLGADMMWNSQFQRPANALHILNVRAEGCYLNALGLYNGCDLDGAENYFIKVSHGALPTNHEAVTLLTKDLAAVAAAVTATGPSGAAEVQSDEEAVQKAGGADDR